MSALLAALCTFLALFLGFATVRARARGRQADSRVRALGGTASTDTKPSTGLLRSSPSSLPVLRDVLSGAAGERIRLDLERAGLNLRPGQYVAVRVFLAAILFAFSLVIFRLPVGLLVAPGLAFLGLLLPALYVKLRTGRRAAAISGQLAESQRMMANSLRAGMALLVAIQNAADQLRPPISVEFNRVLADMALGSSFDDALRSFAERVNSYEAQTMVTAVVIQRGTGGNLADILDKVAETIEERDRIRGEVRTFTAQQRLTGNILSAYPTILALLFLAIHPGLMSLLFTDSIGRILLAIGISLQVIGFLSIRRILSIDF